MEGRALEWQNREVGLVVIGKIKCLMESEI